jgi:hypothetical protein
LPCCNANYLPFALFTVYNQSFYAYPGIVEFQPKAELLDLGFTFRHHLLKCYGPCWVTQWVLDWVGFIDVNLRERLIERYLAVPVPKRPFPPRPSPGLTGPPPELLEAAILGGIIRAASGVIHGEGGGIDVSVKRLHDLRPDHFEKQVLGGVTRGLKELQSLYADSLKQSSHILG